MKKNPLKELMDSEKKSLIFANTVVFIVMIISLFYLEGCGDYYINVDKEAIKMEVDSLIDGKELKNELR